MPAPSGSAPTPTRSTTRPDAPSSATTVAVVGEAIQIRPSPTAMPAAPRAAAYVFVTRAGPGPGAMRETVPSAEFVTQTARSSTATPLGPFPTVIVCTTSFSSGLMRDTVPSRPFATQTAPAPTATPAGALPTSIVSTTSLLDGSIRETVLSPAFVTQTAPSPAAISAGDSPTAASVAMLPLSASMTPTALGATDAFAPEPPPWVSSTPAATPTSAAANVAAMNIRRSGRRRHRGASAASAAWARCWSSPVFSGGKSCRSPSATSWKIRSGRGKSFRVCSPRSTSR
jgi:hypothetical protein